VGLQHGATAGARGAAAQRTSRWLQEGGRKQEFSVNGGPTYWSADGRHFLYWCRRELRWKGARAADLQRIAAGSSASFVAAPLGANLLSPSLLRGWHEWDGASWTVPHRAGISSIGPVTAPLRTVTLAGFERALVNTDYLERRQLEFSVNARETYWSLDGQQLLYWCKKETRWKSCASSHLDKIQSGCSVGFAGAPVKADILSPSLLKGWHEWYGKEWVFRPHAGVCDIRPGVASLRTVTLEGFKRAAMNKRYHECRRPDSFINGRETYCSLDRAHLIYWCAKESRWKASCTSHVPRIRAGRSSGFLGAPLCSDILSPSLLRGWHEWHEKRWSFRLGAGVASIGVIEEALLADARSRPLDEAEARELLGLDPAEPEDEWEAVEEEDEGMRAPNPGDLSGTDTEGEDEEALGASRLGGSDAWTTQHGTRTSV